MTKYEMRILTQRQLTKVPGHLKFIIVRKTIMKKTEFLIFTLTKKNTN